MKGLIDYFSFKQKIAGFFALVLVVLVVIFFAFRKNRDQAAAAFGLIEHTREVLLVTGQVNTLVSQLQSNARGYMISGDSDYLSSFNNSVRSIDSIISRLRQLTKDNTAQQIRIDSLQQVIDDYISSRHELVNVRKDNGFDPAQKIFMKGEGNIIFGRVKTFIDAIEQNENQLLAKRKTASEQSMQNASRITIFFQVIIALILLAAFLVIYRNSRSRDEAVAELQKSEQFIKTIINNTSNPITIRDLSGNYILINDPVAKLFNKEENKIIGKNSYDFLPKETAGRAMEADKECARLKSPTHSEIKLDMKDGTHYFSVNRFPLLNKKNDVYAIGTVSTDITTIRRAEEQIRRMNIDLEQMVESKTREIIQKEWQYRFLIEQMREGIQIIDDEWRYVFVNDSLVKQSKYSREQLLGRTIMESYPGVEGSELFRVLKLCMEERIPQLMESEFVFPDGTAEWFELSIQPVPEGIFILSMDITDRKKAEMEMKRYADELKSSNIELERFAYVASHDLQEPLRMVSSFLNLLEDEMQGKLDETTQRYINFAVDGASRMKLLVNDLLQYSRIGTSKTEFTAVDLNETMDYVLRVYDEEIKKSGAAITIRSMPVIHANRTLIGQLFLNLTGNALKYHSDKPIRIEIGFTEDPDKYIFHVKDNGIGIDPRFFDKIFIIFQRLHGKADYSGTGIGLAICKKIVDVHKGKIWVESKEEEGSSFYFSIPKKSIV